MAKRKRTPLSVSQGKRRPKRIKETNLIDIVIPVYGQPEFTRLCVKHVLESALKLEESHGRDCYRIILVDDQSPNQTEMKPVLNTVSKVRNVSVYQMGANSGFPATANAGASYGHGKYIVFVNTDCLIEPEALPEIIKTFEDDSDCGVVGAKLLFHPDNQVVDHNPRMSWLKEVDDTHGIIQHAGIAFGANGPLHLYLGWPGDSPAVNRYRTDLKAVTGALFATPRKVWNQVTAMYQVHDDTTNGGFNHVYGRGCFEDLEYCLAITQPDIGKHVVYNPKIVGWHYTGLSAMHTNPQMQGYSLQRNANIFQARCGDLVEVDDIVRW